MDKFRFPMGLTLDEVQRRYVLATLYDNDDNRTQTAKSLGIAANTLWRKLKRWGVPPGGQGPWKAIRERQRREILDREEKFNDR